MVAGLAFRTCAAQGRLHCHTSVRFMQSREIVAVPLCSQLDTDSSGRSSDCRSHSSAHRVHSSVADAFAQHLSSLGSVLISLVAFIAGSPAPVTREDCDLNLPDAICSACVLSYYSV